MAPRLQQEGGPAAAAARGQGRHRPPARRARLRRGHRPDARLDRDRGPRPRRGLPRDRGLQGGHPRPQGPAPLHDRPAAVRGQPGPGQGARRPRPRRSSRARHQDVVRYEPLVAKNAISRQDYETAVQVQRAAEASRGGGARPRSRAARARPLLRARRGARRPASRARPRSIRARSWAAGRARCSPASPRSRPSTSASASPRGTTSSTAAQARSGGPAGARPLPVRDGPLRRAASIPRRASSSSWTAAWTRRRAPSWWRSAFPNPGGMVRPGQFARVRVAVDEKKGAILVPQRAVTELQGVYNVAVVKPDDTVELRDGAGRASASAPSGSSTPASRRASGSWSRACRRCARA